MRPHVPVRASDIRKSVSDSLVRVVRSEHWGGRTSPMVPAFESAFAKKFGMPHAVSVNSGTSALFAALVGVGVKPGDEVLVPTLSVSCVGQAVLHAGAIPVFVDAEPHTCNLDPVDLERKITRRSRAVIAVHLFGLPCDMDAMMGVAKRHQLKVVDDAAQALLARYRGKYVGTFGDVGVFSFEQVKQLNTGEGGMVITSSKSIADSVRAFAHFQYTSLSRSRESPWSLRDTRIRINGEARVREDQVAYNFRMTAFQAAVGLAQLPYIEELVADRVRKALKDLKKIQSEPWAVPQWVPSHVESSFFRAAVVVKGISVLRALEEFRRKGLNPRPWFTPLHRDPMFRRWAGKASCPVADQLTPRLFVL